MAPPGLERRRQVGATYDQPAHCATATDRCRRGGCGVAPTQVWCNTWRVPTTRPRIAVTETDAIVRALDVAARRWPGKTRAQLLALLVEAGVDHVQDDEARRQARITDTSGALTGVYGPGYLDELRQDWPA